MSAKLLTLADTATDSSDPEQKRTIPSFSDLPFRAVTLGDRKMGRKRSEKPLTPLVFLYLLGYNNRQ
jgi:hypothetical protein